MMIGTCRTELSNQLGSATPRRSHSPTTTCRAARAVRAGGRRPGELVSWSAAIPSPPRAEVFFTITTARGYWLDSVLQTERKAAQAHGGAPVYSYRLMWRTPVEGGRRITPHSLDLPFVFDNVAAAADMVGPPTDETARCPTR